MRTLTEDLLTMLQQCANKLLLAYDETLRPDVWEAFEKTADACETLALQHQSKTTFH
jgi:hypothetical protein